MSVDNEKLLVAIVIALGMFTMGIILGCMVSEPFHRSNVINNICNEKQYDFCKPVMAYYYQTKS